MGRLSGKVAIITGAANGQGAAEARLFAKEGAKVVATDMQFELLEKVVAEINAELGEVAIAVKHNVADEPNWIEVVKTAVEKFGQVDILINNAGITGKGLLPIEELDAEEWNKVMNINALGNVYGIKHVVPEMKKLGKGSIVNISSLSGITGMGGMSAYTASKGATRLFTKGAAKDLGPFNIRVNSVHPGYINTPMIQEALEKEEYRAHFLSQVPLGFIGEPDDVAYAVLFLASDEARFISGTEMIIDGAQSIRG
ncbi:glucose 1-dehydrogenase [Cytobacillus kochii]|uniref:SDR family NAD(P)-dependent oxidoreductase n=1 Tax=Cytobacillus kochii TaxID=859143 RepID=UPI001CD419B9|nr:glucose 1-dehydrogenase [Cytobacillus kochii]MCA1024479.1 glucose 1-dehydrogenase [Cytobacillus kochii]